MTDDLLTTEDVAKALGVIPRRVRAIAEAHKVGRRIGRPWAFTKAELDQLLQERAK